MSCRPERTVALIVWLLLASGCSLAARFFDRSAAETDCQGGACGGAEGEGGGGVTGG